MYGFQVNFEAEVQEEEESTRAVGTTTRLLFQETFSYHLPLKKSKCSFQWPQAAEVVSLGVKFHHRTLLSL